MNFCYDSKLYIYHLILGNICFSVTLCQIMHNKTWLQMSNS